MADRYEPSTFEQKWRDRWKAADLFKTREEEGRPKFYGLDFFPYPSGAGLSVGHCRNFVPTDVLCRMRYMQGYNVLHPMGFDAFGLPAENEAIKRHSHPAPMIEQYAANYQRQMELIGISYDWSRSFKSSDPDYYKWTQWIFELLYKKGLAYRKMAAVNWDPIDKTVLADEEIIGGRAERSGALVEKKYIPQWFFKITEYGQQLVDDLETIDWPEGIKVQQRNWIGRSEGVQFEMVIAGTEKDGNTVFDLNAEQGAPKKRLTFEVFTTRIDTIFGMSFCVLAPEHPLVAELPVSAEHRAAIEAYQIQAKTLSDIDRQATTREKTGVFTGAYAINPATGNQVPIWIADYVLATYGTGAIMAVPAGDNRDLDFAVKFAIPVIPIQTPTPEYFRTFLKEGETEDYERDLARYMENPRRFEQPFLSKDAPLINAGEYTGMNYLQASESLGIWVESLGIGKRKVQFKLRDWLISRQRYWGCPIPIIHSKDGEMELVPENALPVELPWVEQYEPSGDGTSPLAHIPEFVNVVDHDGSLAKRETDTMGGFACSSWYFLRFADPFNFQQPWSAEAAAYWMPVDTYVGGAEHAVMHLLYARFWTKVLYDAGLVTVKEPFQSLRNQGQVLGYTPYRKAREGETLGVGEEGILVTFAEAAEMPKEDLMWRWTRMSKSKGNVVTPDEAVAESGADALRLYLLFRAPFETDIEWENKGMGDLARFLSRVFRLVEQLKPAYDPNWRDLIPFEEASSDSKKLRRFTHQAIRNVTADIDRFKFNTYVSWMMQFFNGIGDTVGKTIAVNDRALVLAISEALEALILMLSPGAPHSADELWEFLGNSGFAMQADWPTYEEALAADDTKTIAVQVNGKLRDTFDVAADIPSEELEALAKQCEKVLPHLEGKIIKKVVVVPGKLVNIVAI